MIVRAIRVKMLKCLAVKMKETEKMAAKKETAIRSQRQSVRGGSDSQSNAGILRVLPDWNFCDQTHVKIYEHPSFLF